MTLEPLNYSLSGWDMLSGFSDTHRISKTLRTKKEIIKIINGLNKKGYTLIATKLFFDDHGRAKLEVGLARGKKLYDKRESIKERDWKRDKERLI